MSQVWISNSGSVQSFKVEICVIRWGGGADPGRYHVFALSVWRDFWAFPSHQCVVDDFGELVPVEEAS